jgi:hypothetical protein
VSQAQEIRIRQTIELPSLSVKTQSFATGWRRASRRQGMLPSSNGGTGELKQSRAETEADLRRAKAQIARAEARHKRDREHDRSELASTEGIIAALETVQLAARDGEARMRALLRSASDYAVIETDLDGRNHLLE